MPFEAYKLYQEYEPDKYKTSTKKKERNSKKERLPRFMPSPVPEANHALFEK